MSASNKNKKESWLKTHKKGIILTGLSVVALVGVVLIARKPTTAKSVLEIIKKPFFKPEGSIPAKKQLQKLVKKSHPNSINKRVIPKTSETLISIKSPTITEIESGKEFAKEMGRRAAHTVSEHTRNLPDGWHASAKKIAEAAELGIPLKEGQTIVDAYERCAVGL